MPVGRFGVVLGSNFNRDRKGVLLDLFATMASMGITPIGSAEVDLGAYSEHRTVSPFATSEEVPSGDDCEVTGAPAAESLEVMTAGARDIRTSAKKVGGASMSQANGSPVEAETDSKVTPPVQTAMPLQSGDGQYSEDSLNAFVNRHGMQSEDFRAKGGALWVHGNASVEITRQLKTWGFAFTPKRGWWRK